MNTTLAPLVSVVLPVYNAARVIRSALDALTMQAYADGAFEIIVADNGSTDETLHIVEQYGKQHLNLIRVVLEDRIQGSYAARNKGILAANGELLAFTDADCAPIPGWLSKGVGALAREQAGLAAGCIEMVFWDEEPNIWEYLDASRHFKQRDYVEAFGFGATANLFVRRALFDKYGLFRDDLQSGGDLEFGLRLTGSGEKLIYAKEAIVYHPALVTFESMLRKTKRVAKGQKKLKALGVLDARAFRRRLLSSRRSLFLDDVSISASKRLAVLVMAAFFKCYRSIQGL